MTEAVWIKGEVIGHHVDGQPMVEITGEGGQAPVRVWVARQNVVPENATLATELERLEDMAARVEKGHGHLGHGGYGHTTQNDMIQSYNNGYANGLRAAVDLLRAQADLAQPAHLVVDLESTGLGLIEAWANITAPRIAELEAALATAAGWFRGYEQQHRAKWWFNGGENLLVKVRTNAERALFCENVLADSAPCGDAPDEPQDREAGEPDERLGPQGDRGPECLPGAAGIPQSPTPTEQHKQPAGYDPWNPTTVPWNPDAAKQEGWGLCESVNGRLEIRRFSSVRFYNDGMAAAHVLAEASAGSSYHQEALALILGIYTAGIAGGAAPPPDKRREEEAFRATAAGLRNRARQCWP